MSLDPKRVVPPGQADTIDRSARVYRFAINLNPSQKIKLPAGEVVWHIPIQHGIPQGYGTFETTSKELAEQLSGFAEKNPGYLIFKVG